MQRGGAKDHLLGSGFAEDITTAEEMMEKVSFTYMSCHSVTDTTYLTTIPEDTFLVFTGISGYTAYAQLKRNPTEKGVINQDYLLSTELFKSETQWAAAVFDNFFKGNYTKYRMYKGMQIFCPGDMIQNARASFTHNVESTLWGKGLYQIPMTPEKAGRLINDSSDQIKWIGKSPLYIIMSKKDTNPAIAAAFEAAKPVAAYKELFEGLSGISNIEEFAPIYNRLIDSLKLDGAIREGKFMGTIFEEPDAFNEIFENLGYLHDDNLLISQGLNAVPSSTIKLSRILYELKPPAGKKYKFIIYMGCRNPMFLPAKDAENVYNPFPTHRTIPRGVEPRRRLTRRLSLASKELECGMNPSPKFNLRKIKELINQREKNEAAKAMVFQFYDIFKTTKKSTDDNILVLLTPIRLFEETFDAEGKPMFDYAPEILMFNIAYMINKMLSGSIIGPITFGKFEKGSPRYEKYLEAYNYCNELTRAYGDLFHQFAVDLRADYPDLDPEKTSLGKLLLTEAGHNVGDLEKNVNLKFVYEGEKAWTGKAVEAEILRQRKAEFDAHDKWEVQELLEYFKARKRNMQIFLGSVDDEIKKLQNKTKRSTSLSMQMALEAAFLDAIKKIKSTAHGIGGKGGYEVRTWESHLEEFEKYSAKYKEIAEFGELATPIQASIKEYKEGHEKFDGIVSSFEKRVGELAIQIQEEQDLAAFNARRRVLLPQLVEVAKAQKTKAGFGKAYTKAMKVRAQKNATLRKEMFRQEKEEAAAAAAAGSKLASKLAPLWKAFTARKKNEAQRSVAASKIQSKWRNLTKRRAESKMALAKSKRLESLRKATAESARRRKLTAEERKAENNAKVAAKAAAKASKAASKASKVGLKKAAKSGSKLAEALLGAI